MAEPVQNLAPSVEHFGSSLAHAIGVRELTGAAPDRSQSGLVEGDVLRLGQSLQQSLSSSSSRRFMAMTPWYQWYHVGSRSLQLRAVGEQAQWQARTVSAGNPGW